MIMVTHIWIPKIEYIKICWFGYGITLIKIENTKLPYRKYQNGKIPKTLISKWPKINILKLKK